MTICLGGSGISFATSYPTISELVMIFMLPHHSADPNIAKHAMDALAAELTQLVNAMYAPAASKRRAKSTTLLKEAAQAALNDDKPLFVEKISSIPKVDSQVMMDIAFQTNKTLAGEALKVGQLLSE